MAMSNKVARNPSNSHQTASHQTALHQTARELGATVEMFFVFLWSDGL